MRVNKEIITELVRDEITLVASSTAPSIKSRYRVRPGTLLKLTRLVVRNETHGATSFTVYIDDGGKTTLLSYQSSPAVSEIYTLTTEVWLKENEKVRVDYVGATASDVIRLNLFGEIYPDVECD